MRKICGPGYWDDLSLTLKYKNTRLVVVGAVSMNVRAYRRCMVNDVFIRINDARMCKCVDSIVSC